MTLNQYRDLYVTSDLVLWKNGSLKIHKKRNPLRLITDYINSMVYTTSKAIANLLKPLVSQTIYHVKNTSKFSKQLRDLRFEEDDIMNSHDVVSLLTHVPIDKVMAVIWKWLEHDKTLSSRMNLTPNNVMSLLEFVMSMTYFKFDGEYYQWIHGTPIRSRVFVEVSTGY